jgi:hypothetical protein
MVRALVIIFLSNVVTDARMRCAMEMFSAPGVRSGRRGIEIRLRRHQQA